MANYFKLDHQLLKVWQSTITQYKSEAASLGRRVVHFDPKVPFRRFLKIFTNMDDDWPDFSSHVIWLSITAFVVSIVFLTRYSDLRAYIRAKNCKVSIDWHRTCPNRVGGLVEVKISLFQSPTSFRSLSFPATETIEDLISNITIRVMLQKQEEIVVDKDVNTEDQSIRAQFLVRKAGTYFVHVWYRGYEVKDSPFSATMDPLSLDPCKSYIGAKSPVIIVKNQQFKIDVVPIDAFGNRCATTLDDRQRLKFQAKKWEPPSQQHSEDDQNLNGSTDFQTSIGMRREDAENPNLLPIYTIYGKCRDIGVYTGSVLFGEETKNLKSIQLMSITPEEDLIVSSKKSAGRCKLDAVQLYQLERAGNHVDEEMQHVPEVGVSKISVELSTRFLSLTKKLYGGPIETRLCTWRIEEDTTLKILNIIDNPNADTYVIRISNPTLDLKHFNEVLMCGSDARVFFALFHDFKRARLCNDNSSHIVTYPSSKNPCQFQSLEFKQKALYEGMRENIKTAEPQKQQYSLLTLRRNAIVETTLEVTKNFTILDWAKPFIVSFLNESVKADGSAWIEWSEILLDRFFESNDHGMFVAKNFSGGRKRPGLIHPNPNRHQRWTLEHYELAGKIVGKYMLETAKKEKEGTQIFVNARFSRSMLASILMTEPTYKHLELDDPDEYKATFEPILKQDLAKMKLTYVTTEYDRLGTLRIVELIPNGNTILVTNENKIAYLNALAKFHLTSKVQKELDAFVLGLTFFIPEELLNMFDENELEIMLCGSTPLNLIDFQLHLNPSGDWNVSFGRVKEWLWKALEDMDYQDLGRFYQFISGSSRLPKGGFKELIPTLSMSALYGQLPTADTTCCQLSLTDHDNYENFQKALTTAIRNCNFDISK